VCQGCGEYAALPKIDGFGQNVGKNIGNGQREQRR